MQVAVEITTADNEMLASWPLAPRATMLPAGFAVQTLIPARKARTVAQLEAIRSIARVMGGFFDKALPIQCRTQLTTTVLGANPAAKSADERPIAGRV
ncbi:MAG: hypothetical protein U1E47_03475 [Rivihabitans pingtungensis]